MSSLEDILALSILGNSALAWVDVDAFDGDARAVAAVIEARLEQEGCIG